MRIVHLNTHSYGGAAVVARRLHAAALAHGMDSYFVTQYGLRSDPTPRYSALQDARVLYLLRAQSSNRGLYKLGKWVQHVSQHKNLVNRPEGFDVFSPLNTRRKYSDCASAYAPDIIHLHWVNGFLDHAGFFRHNRERKFVWTLHDMNPLTGGCHHSDGCMAFKQGCGTCPQLAGTIDAQYARAVLISKQASLAQLRDDQLTIVAPSQWLMDLSVESPITRRFPHVLIDNPTTPAVASVGRGVAQRAQLGLPAQGKIVLFASDNLRNPRKGFETLFAAARLMRDRGNVHFVGIGQRMDAPRDLNVSFPGRIVDDATRMKYFACADVIVSPSVAENAPLVVIEGLSCGTPVVAFKVGGIPELVDEQSGVLAEQHTAEGLAGALEQALWQRSFERAQISGRARRFMPDVVFEKYKQVYEEMLAVAV
jgi:glycosyltransferase involved in cell wall biosynthesis